eukprot:jgi/Tetstr1/458374/TSEL_044812.t1
MMCYGVFTASAHAALPDVVATLRAQNATARDTADSNDLLDSAIRTITTCGQAAEDRLTCLRRFKCKKALTGEDRVAERLVYSLFYDATAADRSSNGVDGLLSAMNGRQTTRDIGASDQVLQWIQEGVRIPFKHNRPPPNLHNSISMHDATTPAQLTFLEGELARCVESGAWEVGTCRKWVSRHFLVPKPGVNQWCCIIDLRMLNPYCADRDYFIVRGQLYKLAGLPMGGSLMPYYFVTLTQAPDDNLRVDRLSRHATRLIGRATRNARWLPVRESQSLAGQTQYPFLAIPAARFFLRELHSVVGDRWGGRVRMTPQLRRDLQWWTSVPG